MDNSKRKARWAWRLGVWLMLGLGIFSSTASPTEKPAPLLLEVGNAMAASGANTTPRFLSHTYQPTTTLTQPSHPAVMLKVAPAIQSQTAQLRVAKTRTLPPLWASDEVRGVRKKFRG